VTIVDFGIAKSGGASGATLFQAKGAYTPCYASPEQTSLGVTSPQSDIYSVGVTLYEMLTGKVAQIFPADSSVRFNNDNVRALPGVRSEMAQILLTAVSVNEKLRYSNANELADALRQLKGGSSGYTPPSSVAAYPTPPAHQPGTSIAPTPDQTTIFDIRRKKP
jgi:serine/threonine-protein kinase